MEPLLSADDEIVEIIDSLLESAHRNALWLTNRRRPESLHDFRVALRRLRCWLKVAKLQGFHLSTKLCRKVNKLARSTNAARDAEVQLDLLTTVKATWLRAEWRAKVAQFQQIARRDFGDEYLQIEKPIRAALKKRKPPEKKGPSFVGILRPVIDEARQKLKKRLKKIKSADDQEEMHRARIAAKNLRYLLEPLVLESPQIKSTVEELKSLQDTLGKLHDLHILYREAKKRALNPSDEKKAKKLMAEIAKREKALYPLFQRGNLNLAKLILRSKV